MVLGLLLIGVASLPLAGHGFEIGLGANAFTSFRFQAYSLGIDASVRFAGTLLAWEVALGTDRAFGSLLLKNTLATPGRFHVLAGHRTYLLPFPVLGSTYVFAGVGWEFARIMVLRLSVSVATAVGAPSLYLFPIVRFQLGLRVR